jgi:TrmH family RNA methyltransferase
MVSKNQIKLITGLQQKKFRTANGLFIAEGAKVIGELLHSRFELVDLFQTESVFEEKGIQMITEADLKKLSALSTPNNCLAVFKIPVEQQPQKTGLIIALDDIRDPGNLGAIIRLCDWFGVKQLVCSSETADLYNPKVVQATMGSMARVQVNYVDLKAFLTKSELPIFGTFMDGENVYKQNLPKDGIVILGNEANGISEEVEKIVKNRLAIPRFGILQQTESLNVATAAAIILSEFRRE